VGVVNTTSGAVRGSELRGVWAFKGVPYGDDTSGAGRFKPPRPARASAGVRDCVDYGPSCPQNPMAGSEMMTPEVERAMGVLASERVTGEDCLVLNVWTSALDETAQRPVLVWLHGGWWSIGSASWPLYEFDNLARDQDVVMVGVNHRLGILGFLDLSGPDDAEPDSGNVGMLDVVAALEWIRDNIAAFGGDPGNVTVFGESGGGAKTSVLMAMPAARGLFHNALVMSGATLSVQTKEAAAADREAVFDGLGIDRDVEQLRKVGLAKLFEVDRALQEGKSPIAGNRGFYPVLGPSLPLHPLDAIRGGAARGVSAVIGCTTDEMMSFLFGVPNFWSIDDEVLANTLGELFGGDPFDRVLADYRTARPGESPTALLIAIMSDRLMRVPHIRLAEAKLEGGGAPTYMYLFSWGHPDPTGRIRSGHGSDMPYFFDNLDKAPAAAGPQAVPLIQATRDALLALARRGNPNHDGLPDWPPYTVAERPTMYLDIHPAVEFDPLPDERRAWDTTELTGI
jgi:para-nitrobenzyl esterase